MSKKFVYVVDDDDFTRNLIVKMLNKNMECDVACFTGGDELLASLEGAEKLPDIIISDIRMPTGNGLRLKGTLEEMELDIPIIYITALDGPELIEDDLVILSKPINQKSLIKKIEELLGSE